MNTPGQLWSDASLGGAFSTMPAEDYHTAMRLLVDACYLLAAVLVAPILVYRAITTGKYRQGWGQRLGRLPDLPAGRPRVWVHAVSVGETNAVRGLIAAWREHCPETEFVLSTTTDTGLARARTLFPDLTIVRYPLDFSVVVARALDRLKPSMVVLVELEVWYQLVTMASARGVPVVVVNGRLSAASYRRFGRIRSVARRMFGALTWVGAQDETYAERFRHVGVPADRVQITGSLKWDAAEVTDTISGCQALARALGLAPGRPTWVCGSTGPGEEEVILRAVGRLRQRHPDVQLVLVPRKPERFDEVAALVQRSGYTCIRRSESPDGGGRSATPAGAVWLGDTMGELRQFYALAGVVFVGRSLAAMGGSDMMEVAALARPIVVGPHTENFADVVRRLEQADAIRIIHRDLRDGGVADALASAVGDLLDDPAAARRLGERGRDVVRQSRGSTQRTLASLMEIMHRAQHRSSQAVGG